MDQLHRLSDCLLTVVTCNKPKGTALSVIWPGVAAAAGAAATGSGFIALTTDGGDGRVASSRRRRRRIKGAVLEAHCIDAAAARLSVCAKLMQLLGLQVRLYLQIRARLAPQVHIQILT